MKKILIAFLLLCAVVLSACSAKIKTEDYSAMLETQYTVNGVIVEDGCEYTVRMSREKDGTYKIVFAQPDALWGMGCGFDGEDSYLIYNDMSIALQDSILESGAATGIYRWHELMSPSGEFSAKNVSLDGTECVLLEDGERKIYFTKEDKAPYKLECGNTEISFRDFICGEKNEAESESDGTDKS